MLTSVRHASVRITSALESLNVLEGTIFSVDPITNVIAINTATPSPNPNSNTTNLPGNYHVLCFSSIQSYELLSLPTEADRAEGYGPGFDGALPSIEKLDMAALRAREEEAIRKLKEQDRRRGKGVTKEAQALFDDLIKVYCTLSFTYFSFERYIACTNGTLLFTGIATRAGLVSPSSSSTTSASIHRTRPRRSLAAPRLRPRASHASARW